MLISPKTKISALIKANPAAIEAIASINPHFEKLRNPILRKILASRVTIEDAARIGGTEVARFFEKLQPLGFEPENDSVLARNTLPEPTVAKIVPKPAFRTEAITELDVREAISTGNDPFNLILDGVTALQPGQALKLINTFEPTPLIAILAKRGYSHFTEILCPELVHTFFYPNHIVPATGVTPAEKEVAAPAFAELLEKYDGNFQLLDVRNLEMPQPMVTILEKLPALKTNEALYVHHKRIPQFLLPQLRERGYDWAVREISDDLVHLLIFKN